MSIAVTPVSTTSNLEDFIAAPHKIYTGNPHWVPHLTRLERKTLSAKHNPFFQHADVELFVAREGEEVLGRISAQVDHEHNRYHKENLGFFGFFDSVNDPNVASALTNTAEMWLKKKGMDRVRGPLSFSINGEAGLLIDGFDSPPQVMMPYSQPYYLDILEETGFRKAKDLYAWRYDWTKAPAKATRSVKRLRERSDVKVRKANMAKFRYEVHQILDVFNEAWSENWGFVPMTPAEARKMGDDLKQIVDPDVVIMVEIEGRIAGTLVFIPNMNEAMHDLNGTLSPFGFLKLLWRIKGHRIKNGRVLLMGIRKEYRTREFAGLTYLLIDELMKHASDRGYQWVELSWTLEDNHAINKIVEHMGCKLYKTYRLFEKELV